MTQVVIVRTDEDGYKFIGCEAVAVWPEDLEMTPERVERVTEHWQGDTLAESDVVRVCGS